MTEPSTETQIAIQQPRNELRLSGPRLPYHPLIEERFGIDRGTWKFLTDVLYPTAEEPETIINVLAYCKARKLDVLKKPVHVVPVWDKKRNRMVDSVWPSIAEVRITATRTGLYAGRDETIFGPDKTESLGGIEVTYPEWAQVTVYRYVAGQACAFVGEKVRWKEYYAKAKRDTLAPNDMWKTKTYSQLAKCAEANALRCAFPEEDGGPTAEEMAGQEVESLVSSEPLIGSGVRARLEQQSEKPTEGFNAAALETLGEETETATEAEEEADPQPDPEPPKPKRGRPSKAEMEARAKAVAEAEQASQAGQAPEEPPEASTELPIEPETASEAEFTPLDPQDPNAWMVLAEIDGPAPAGEEYTLLEDEPVNGKLNVYRDGVVIGVIGPEDSGSYNAYDSHPEAEDDGFPGDQPAPVIGETVVADQPDPPGAFGVFWRDYIKTETSQWSIIKDALRILQSTPDYKALSPSEQNAWRRMAGQAIAAKIEEGQFELDPLDDATAYRYALETWDDPEYILQQWEAFQGFAVYEALASNLKDALAKAVAERIATLEAA